MKALITPGGCAPIIKDIIDLLRSENVFVQSLGFGTYMIVCNDGDVMDIKQMIENRSFKLKSFGGEYHPLELDIKSSLTKQ